jgi:succinate dehydrogenase / fumarate reductase membrane anchor subunit
MSEIPHRVIADPKTHYGAGRPETRWFLVQRITGALNVLLTLFLIWFVVRLAGGPREDLVGAIRSPWVWAPLLVLVVNVPLHMRIGMREVIEDYVHDEARNRLALAANTAVAAGVAAVGALSILKIAIWG